MEIKAADGATLRGTLYDSSGDDAIVVAAAMGVPRRYYDAFAQHAASRGFTTLLFDYRGMGESRRSAAGKVLKGTRVNTGRVFQADGKLNLILGEVHGQNKKRNVYGQWDEDFFEARVGHIARFALHRVNASSQSTAASSS